LDEPLPDRLRPIEIQQRLGLDNFRRFF